MLSCISPDFTKSQFIRPKEPSKSHPHVIAAVTDGIAHGKIARLLKTRIFLTSKAELIPVIRLHADAKNAIIEVFKSAV